MGKFTLIEPGTSLAADLFWQSSLLLVVGLAASVALGRRPARAHAVLLLAIAGSLVTPLCSRIVHRAGWGLVITMAPDDPPAFATTAPGASVVRPVQPTVGRRDRSEPEKVARQVRDAKPDMKGSAGAVDERRSRASGWLSPRDRAPILQGLWCILSGLCAERLIVALIMGRRAVGRTCPVTCSSMELGVVAACTRLDLRVRPDLRASSQVDCPAIWCWGRRPTIVLPQVDDAAASVDWVSVFCHELAHWRRRDHLASLLAEVLVCALPWHPLAWLARHRLGQQSELACDDWAVAGGQEPAAYAETLLELLPRRRTLTALAAVSRRSGLAARITHLLALHGPVEPRPGRVWSGAVVVAAVGLVAVLALAQAREGRARSDEAQKPRAAGQPAAVLTPGGHQFARRTVRGTVRDMSGKPIAGASIFAAGQLEPKERANGWYFTHHGEEQQILAQASSDRQGKFVLDVTLDPAVVNVDVIARSAGMGLTARNYSARPDNDGQMFFEPLDDRPVELALFPNIPIEGRLLSQVGKPVSGVAVSLTVLELGENPDGFFLRAATDDGGRPVTTPYWPEPVVTDAEGRFRFDGLSEKGVARVTFTHEAYIFEQLIISTESELTGYRRAWQMKAVPPRFTHVLETARPIGGIVRDEDTGRPLAGIRVEIGAMGGGPSLPIAFPATTDAQGRYRIIGVGWSNPEGLYAQLLPDAISGYFANQRQHKEWPAGVAELRWNLTLRKGLLVRGRVIDADTKRPIAGARVAAERVNQTVVTDEHGSFLLCVARSDRSLFVEGPTRDYRRVTVPHGEVRSNGGVYHPHGYARITVSAQGTVAPVEIAIKKGATIAAQGVDPQGKPLSNVWITGEALFVQSNYPGALARRCSSGAIRAKSFEPGQHCRVFFLLDERHLAGFADLTARPEPTEPVNVMLQATARVRGKLLRPDGTPSRRTGVSAYFLLFPEQVKLEPMDFLRQDRVLSYGMAAHRESLVVTTSDDDGAFEVNELMAGVRNYLAFWPVTSNEIHYIPIDPLQPGEVRDLGAIKPIVLTEKRP